MTTSLWNGWRYSNASCGHAHARLGVVAVHVEDRRLHGLGDVAAVQRAARVLRAGGEADLVVDDEVDGAADAVAGDVAHREALGHDALAGERGVAVDAASAATGTSRAGRSGPAMARTMPSTIGIDGLEVAGVGGQLDADVGAGRALVLAGRAEVVLHVAGALHRAGVDVALELLEDLVVALADDVGEHVEPAAVGHAEHRRVDARRRRPSTGSRRGSGWRSRRLRARSAWCRRTWWRGTSRTPRPR